MVFTNTSYHIPDRPENQPFKRNKKRPHSRTVELKRQVEQEKLASEKDRAKKRMDPTARLLLYGDLVFLALFSPLGLVEGEADGILSGLLHGAAGDRPVAAIWAETGCYPPCWPSCVITAAPTARSPS